jgi:hypothetical protein
VPHVALGEEDGDAVIVRREAARLLEMPDGIDGLVLLEQSAAERRARGSVAGVELDGALQERLRRLEVPARWLAT